MTGAESGNSKIDAINPSWERLSRHAAHHTVHADAIVAPCASDQRFGAHGAECKPKENALSG